MLYNSLFIDSFVKSSTEPPSEVRDLKIKELTYESVTLTWQTPDFLGGRADLFYTVICDKCSASVIYTPAKTEFNRNTVTITRLLSKTAYTVEIVAENGVSSSARHTEKTASVAFVTLKSGTVEPDDPIKVRKNSANTLLMSKRWGDVILWMWWKTVENTE